MIRIGNAQLWVHDQDEALDFYTQKLGMEVRSDVTWRSWGTSAGSRSARLDSPTSRSC
jgi:catechol 2,3-dioxygenase-like lactoylglutathione lyase family enzyme